MGRLTKTGPPTVVLRIYEDAATLSGPDGTPVTVPLSDPSRPAAEEFEPLRSELEPLPKGTLVRLVLPQRLFMTRLFRLPKTPRNLLASAVALELESSLPMTLDELAYTYGEARLTDGLLVSLLTIPRRIVNAYTELLDGYGLVVEQVWPFSCEVACVSSEGIPAGATVVVAAASGLDVASTPEPGLVYSRHLPMGNTLACDLLSCVAELGDTARGRPIVVLVDEASEGARSSAEAAVAALSGSGWDDIAVRPVRLASTETGAVTGGPWYIPTVETKQAGSSGPSRFVLVSATLLLLGAAGYNLVTRYSMARDLLSERTQLTNELGQWTPASEGADGAQAMATTLTRVRAMNAEALSFLARLDPALGSSTALNDISLAKGGSRVGLTGSCPQATALMARLRELPGVTAVELVAPISRTSGREEFSLSVVLQEVLK